MGKKRECKIVQDLLPNYIDKLTNSQTNQYIEEHLKECEICKEIYDNMQKDLTLNVQKKDSREVKYFKKYRNKLRILKVILILLIVIFIVSVVRKVVIISDLSEKAEEYITSSNYHRITYSYNQENYTKLEVFSLGDKKKIILTNYTDQGRQKTMMFATKDKDDNYIANIYTETEEKKIATLNSNMVINAEPQNTMRTKNIWELLIYSIPSSIKKTTFNGNECYYISNFCNGYNYCPEGLYINKDMGLPISTIAYEYKNSDGTQGRFPATEYVYEFDTVTKDDFIEPNINEYEIQE